MKLDDLPQDLRVIVTIVERLARRLGTPAYLVGGAVRDGLLGRPILDIDVAVEGDALVVARQAAANLPVDLRTYDTFGTAVLQTASGRRIDLASTRAEEYAGVAALPKVRPATIEEDLVRRDFTVNSLALPLASLETAEPIDPSGGRADLARRLLRVHHPRSFEDDPTRILRGVRFEARLGFSFEPETERLARAACAAGTFEALSADRLRAELAMLFTEGRDPRELWHRLEALGLPEALGLRPGEATGELLERVDAALEDWRSRCRQPGIARADGLLSALVLAQNPAQRPAAARRLGIGTGRLVAFEAVLSEIGRPAIAPHEIEELLAPLSPEELVLLVAAGGAPAADRVHAHVSVQRRLELVIDGSTLLAQGFAPGPEIGDALRATREARLDGRITAGEELDFALGVLRRQGGET